MDQIVNESEAFQENINIDAPSLFEQERMIEALLFASPTPLSNRQIEAKLPKGCRVKEALISLKASYDTRGITLLKIGDAWAFRTASDLSFLFQNHIYEMRKLSRAAIETLAIVAYQQPVTRAEIEEIRGVSVSRGTLDQLLELEWIKLGRRRETPGRPVTFIVTQQFLDQFGLETVRDLPGLKELRDAGFLDNIASPTERNASPQFNEDAHSNFLEEDKSNED